MNKHRRKLVVYQLAYATASVGLIALFLPLTLVGAAIFYTGMIPGVIIFGVVALILLLLVLLAPLTLLVGCFRRKFYEISLGAFGTTVWIVALSGSFANPPQGNFLYLVVSGVLTSLGLSIYAAFTVQPHLRREIAFDDSDNRAEQLGCGQSHRTSGVAINLGTALLPLIGLISGISFFLVSGGLIEEVAATQAKPQLLGCESSHEESDRPRT